MPLCYSDSVTFTEKLSSPRIIKTHMPMDHLPPNILDICKGKSRETNLCKLFSQSCQFSPIVVYVCRNPKDTAVSYFHHSKLIDSYSMREGLEFRDYANAMFKTGKIGYGSYWSHLKVKW